MAGASAPSRPAAGGPPLSEELLADCQRVLGFDHPRTLATRANLARVRGEPGDPGGAVPAFEQLLADFQRVLGADHPEALIIRNDLARSRDPAEVSGDEGPRAS
ncbi:tetratricopeptide repeat protein [Pseudofrankia sp. DC12]|uniref:tetratricopeptide repeat protein n=1 Tax=Pseudofrankia sp. DC12 TaxID=683315 RepID=UPI0032D56F92